MRLGDIEIVGRRVSRDTADHPGALVALDVID